MSLSVTYANVGKLQWTLIKVCELVAGTGWWPLDTTTLSSFFVVIKVQDPLVLNFVEDSLS